MNHNTFYRDIQKIVEQLIARGIDVIEHGWDCKNSEPFIVLHLSEKSKNHILTEKLPNGEKISYRYEDVADFAGDKIEGDN